MTSTEYARLSREDLDVLLAPESDALRDSWSRVAGGLHSLMSLVSASYPRPFVSEEDARLIAFSAAAVLRGTRFDSKARANIDAAERLLSSVRRGSDAEASTSLVDRFIEAMLDDAAAIRAYPDTPPPWSRPVGHSPGDRYLAGR